MKEIRISQEVYTKLACLCDARDYDGFSETIEELMKGQEVLL
jgi:predicted CopG family antitoxin